MKKRGKTPEQCRCIEFLYSTELVEKKGGCGSKKNGNMDMDEYLAYVNNMVNNLNLKEKAIEKIGLDESQIAEIPPVHFSSFIWRGDDVVRKWVLKDGIYRGTTNKYTVTWIFFSAEQIYTYTYIFDTTSDNVTVLTRDFFYKDITCIRTQHEVEAVLRSETKKGCGCFKAPEKRYYHDLLHTDSLQITVPSDSYSFEIDSTDTIEQSIQATKAMIREKKNA
jgi:hypothetical protein